MRRQAMGHGGQESQITHLPKPGHRMTKNACQKVSPHKCREQNNTRNMGGTRTDIHTPEKRNIRPLLTVNPQTTTWRDNGTVPLSRSLAEHCQLAHLEDELLRDIFTANMIDHKIQKELLKTALTPEKALELAVSIELRI